MAIETDGEGWGGWDVERIPGWLRRDLAPMTAEHRAKRLRELLDALSAAMPKPIVLMGRTLEGIHAEQLARPSLLPRRCSCFADGIAPEFCTHGGVR